MKRTLFTLMTVVAMLMCGCEKEETPGGSTSHERTPDITPYLGKYLMTRTTDLSINVLGLMEFPLDRDLNVETVTITADPSEQYGVVMTSSDGMYLKGTVDTLGLHLNDEVYTFAIDTLGVNASINVSLTHPTIQQPIDGKMEWTSSASGGGSATVPILGELSCTVTGKMHYRTVTSNK